MEQGDEKCNDKKREEINEEYLREGLIIAGAGPSMEEEHLTQTLIGRDNTSGILQT